MRGTRVAIAAAAMGLCIAGQAAADDHTGEPNWIQDSQSTCWIYNANPQISESIAWTGPRCHNDEAEGVGTVTWFQYNQWKSAEKGLMEGGLMQGAWVRRYATGAVDHSYWIDGEIQQPQDSDVADQDSGGTGYVYTPPTDYGQQYIDTLKQQNRDNCARAAQGANIICNPQ